MTAQWRWSLILGFTATTIAMFMQVPQFLHQRDPRAQGIPVHLNSDEYVYMARVQEALSGRPEQAAEAFIGDPQLRGTQPALIEAGIGTLFRFTGWNAPIVLQIMDSITPPLLFLALYFFLLACGFSRLQSFAGSLALLFIHLYGLNRPIHQRESFLFVVLTLLATVKGLRSLPWAIAAGVLLGLLVGMYFWSWTFAWTWVFLFMVWVCIEGYFEADRRLVHWFTGLLVIWSTHVRVLIVTGIGILVSSPFLWQLWSMSHHPLFEQAVFRSGMHPSRLPESVPYSILFSAMILGILLTARKRYDPIRAHRFAVITVITAFIVMHQQVIHGQIFNFVSHYIFSLTLGAIIAVLLWIKLRERWLMLSAAAACVYLAALTFDGRWVVKQFTVADRFGEQHFATLLPVLNQLPRSTILSDSTASAFVAGSTKHDVVSSVYLKNVLMTHEEITERYCLTQLPLPVTERRIEDEPHLIYPDAVSAFRNDPTVREREVEMVKQACAAEDKDPAFYLKKYKVRYLLWDEDRMPRWDPRNFKVMMEKVSEGGLGPKKWSLWKIVM